jgi:hypothetical protein
VKFNYGQILAAVFGAFFTHQTSFTVGGPSGLTVNVALSSGAPVHLTFGAAFLALETIAGGKTGTFQSGDIVLTIAENAPTSA